MPVLLYGVIAGPWTHLEELWAGMAEEAAFLLSLSMEQFSVYISFSLKSVFFFFFQEFTSEWILLFN